MTAYSRAFSLSFGRHDKQTNGSAISLVNYIIHKKNENGHHYHDRGYATPNVWIGCDDQAILAVVSHIIVTCMRTINY